jgi:alpha-L-rhamnosidase
MGTGTLKREKRCAVVMRFAEVLKDNKTELYMDNLRKAQVTDRYIPLRMVLLPGTFVRIPWFPFC